MNLLQDLQEQKGFSYLFIAHDLAVVRHIADRVLVMYLGRVVEIGPKHQIYSAPQHPYTQALLSAAPEPDPDVRPKRIILAGDVQSPHKSLPVAAFTPAARWPWISARWSLRRFSKSLPGRGRHATSRSLIPTGVMIDRRGPSL